MASLARQWWRCMAAAMKDKRSLYITRVAGRGQYAEMEAAVIRATSQDDRSLDYKNAGHVLAWARTSPACLPPLMRSLSRRARRTRSWAVALKTLLLAHGVLLCSTAAPHLVRLPFYLFDFREHSARSGFCAFVRAYFHFLDHRSVLLSSSAPQSSTPEDSLAMLLKMQELFDLLMQIRPYADGMEVELILGAMDCVVIEIFEAHKSICSGIASFLVDVLGPSSSKEKTSAASEEQRRMGIAGMMILRRAVEQSEQLSSYLSLCRGLGVLNAAEIPPVETIPEEDIRDLEALVLGSVPGMAEEETYPRKEKMVAEVGEEKEKSEEPTHLRSETVITEEWEVFEDETAAAVPVNCSVNPFLCLENESKTAVPWSSWATSVHQLAAVPLAVGNLIELT